MPAFFPRALPAAILAFGILAASGPASAGPGHRNLGPWPGPERAAADSRAFDDHRAYRGHAAWHGRDRAQERWRARDGYRLADHDAREARWREERRRWREERRRQREIDRLTYDWYVDENGIAHCYGGNDQYYPCEMTQLERNRELARRFGIFKDGVK